MSDDVTLTMPRLSLAGTVAAVRAVIDSAPGGLGRDHPLRVAEVRLEKALNGASPGTEEGAPVGVPEGDKR